MLGALLALVNAVAAPRLRWIVLALAPAVVVLHARQRSSRWYVNGFIVKPNELVREAPLHHAQHRDPRGGVRAQPHRPAPVPGRRRRRARSTPTNNQETLQNIRLWDWRALQDTLRQIQEIRTYYDFPDIDIDRYTIDGQVRQMMLAVRELNVERLPESSRNWINEKLIYTHGYGVTMNPVNGFTPEGLPDLLFGNMPVQSTFPALTLTRPRDLLRRTDEHRRVREDATRRSSTTRRVKPTA